MNKKNLLIKANPDLTVRLDVSDNLNINVCIGQGSNRNEYVLNDPKLVALLLGLREPSTRASVKKKLQCIYSYDDERTDVFLDLLEQEKILIDADSALCKKSISHKEWELSGWRDALDFHRATSNVRWTHSYRSWADKPPIMTYFLGDQLVTPDRPRPARKPLDEKSMISLPNSLSNRLQKNDFLSAVRGRRTSRDFNGSSASLLDLAEILKVSCQHILYQGQRPFRPTPTYSLGHFYRLILANPRVAGLESKNFYSYIEEKHCLQTIGSGDIRECVDELFAGQSFVQDAPLIFVLTVQWEQYMWKYRHSRAYRLALFEIGGVAQTILIAATGLGLKTFLSPALNDTKLCEKLGITDQLEESPIYLIAIGG